jgi:hypothetical protein
MAATDLSNFSVHVNTKHVLFQYNADKTPEKFGFAVLQSGDEETLIQYDPQEESIVIDRSRSSLDGAYNNASESGAYAAVFDKREG